MEEYFDIYDENWNHIGTAPRSEVHAKGLRHPVAHCWVIAQNEPVMYFQQRAHGKADFPDHYDLACGGHIHAGEKPADAILREIREEIGLQLTPEQIISLGTYRAPDFKIPGYYDRAIAHVFVVWQTKPVFVPGEEVARMVRLHAGDFYRMEIHGAEKIQAQTLGGEEIWIHRDAWCCHDGEFQTKVLPYLKTAFPEFAPAGD